MFKKGNSRLHFKNILTGLKCKRSTRVQTRAEYGLFSSKRSQITLFVIIAILLVVAIGVIFIVKNSLKNGGVIPQAGTENIENFVTNCLKTTSENGLITLGRQGGYYKYNSEPNVAYSGNDSGPEQKYFTELGNINVPYYFYNSENIIPSKEKIEDQLSIYVEENIDKCLNNFSIFKQKEFIIDVGTINATTNIFDYNVRVSLDYPVTIKKADFTQQKTEYSVDISVRLGLIYNLTRDMIQNHAACSPVFLINNPPVLNLNLNCFNLVRSNDFNIAFIHLDNAALFIFTDPEYKLNNTYYDWIFAYDYQNE